MTIMSCTHKLNEANPGFNMEWSGTSDGPVSYGSHLCDIYAFHHW